MSALAWMADLPVRAFLLAHAFYWLRRAPALESLAAVRSARALAWRALPAAGRHLAVALAMLPRALRREARIAYLLARALDAFEDLSPDAQAAHSGLRAACAYLRHETERPPDISRLEAARDSDRVERLLAGRLELLRAELDALPEAARRNIVDMLQQMALGMEQASELGKSGVPRAAQARSADRVLGQAVLYAVRSAAPGRAAPPSSCLSIARLLQLANDLRDLEHDRYHSRSGVRDGRYNDVDNGGRYNDVDNGAQDAGSRLSLFLRALSDLPLSAHLLRWLPFGSLSGARAATTVLVLTTVSFVCRTLSQERGGARAQLGFRLRRPILAALAAGLRARSYEKSLAAAEAELGSLLFSRFARRAGDGPSPALPPVASPLRKGICAFEAWLAGTHPKLELADAMLSSTILVAYARELVAGLSAEPLEAEARSASTSIRLLTADHLVASAFERIAELGGTLAHDFGRMLAELSLEGAAGGSETAVITFLARAVGEAHGLSGAHLERRLRAHQRFVELLNDPGAAEPAIVPAAGLRAAAPGADERAAEAPGDELLQRHLRAARAIARGEAVCA